MKKSLSWILSATLVGMGAVGASALPLVKAQKASQKSSIATESVTTRQALDAKAVDMRIEKASMSTAQFQNSVLAVLPMRAPAHKADVSALYSNSFDTQESIADWTIIDVANDERTWSWRESSQCLQARYHGSNAKDDWAITPALPLEAGKSYEVKFKANAALASYPELLEVKFGKSATVDGMTETGLAQTSLPGTATEYSFSITPAEAGDYYVGLHAVSEPDMFNIYVDDFEVSAGASALAPGLATNLSAVADAGGALKVDLAFTLPSVALNGEALTALTKAELYCDDALIQTYDEATPGQEITFTHNPEAKGEHTYSVIAYNEEGAGKPASVTVYVGYAAPNAPTDGGIVEVSEGVVNITWTAPTEDINGKTLDPSKITYDVYKNESSPVLVAENVAATNYQYQVIEAGGTQDFVQYLVYAKYEDLQSENYAYSGMIVVGPAQVGFNESFANGGLTELMGLDTTGGASWSLYDDSKLGVACADGDNGFAAMNAQAVNAYADLFTGKVKVEGFNNPVFAYYNYPVTQGDGNQIDILVREIGTEEYTTVSSKLNSDYTPGAWAFNQVDLSAYAGKTIQVAVRGTILTHAYILVDGLRVGEKIEKDLVLRSISAPSTVATGEAYKVSVVVGNQGVAEATGAKLKLFAGEEVVAEKELDPLAADASATVEFDFTMSPVQQESITYKAVVEYEGDEVESNNTSNEVVVKPKQPTVPTVVLEGALNDAGIPVLSWEAPQLGGGQDEVCTETFDEAESFAQDLEGWTFVDKDASPVGGFSNAAVPGITAGESLVSFFIFDNTDDTYNQSFDANSGTKFLASLFRYDSGQADDWAISPALTGNAQTISFYAKSYSANYPEAFEVLYSTGSLNPDEFIKVGEVASVPGEWTQYSYELPAGAKHFAIRSMATDAFMFMVDDVTFERSGQAWDLTISGYNLYRDGVKVNDAPIEATSFVDAGVVDGTHSYQVTVVYTEMESKASNTVVLTVETSAVDDLQIANGKAIYYDLNGIRVDNPENGIFIRVQDGKATKVAK